METETIIDALIEADIPCYRHLSREEKRDGYQQMIADLSLLAKKDGCIAAAFALETFEAIASQGK